MTSTMKLTSAICMAVILSVSQCAPAPAGRGPPEHANNNNGNRRNPGRMFREGQEASEEHPATGTDAPDRPDWARRRQSTPRPSASEELENEFDSSDEKPVPVVPVNRNRQGLSSDGMKSSNPLDIFGSLMGGGGGGGDINDVINDLAGQLLNGGGGGGGDIFSQLTGGGGGLPDPSSILGGGGGGLPDPSSILGGGGGTDAFGALSGLLSGGGGGGGNPFASILGKK